MWKTAFKNLKGYGLPQQIKAVFHKFYFVLSQILCPIFYAFLGLIAWHQFTVISLSGQKVPKGEGPFRSDKNARTSSKSQDSNILTHFISLFVAFHLETSHFLFSKIKHMAALYIKRNTGLKWVN